MTNEIKFTKDSIYYLDKESNPEFYEIFETSNGLIDRYNILMRRLESLDLPSAFETELLLRPELRFKKSRNEINKIGAEIVKLDQEQFVPWKNKASDYIIKPDFKLQNHLSKLEKKVVTSHYIDLIRYRIQQLSDSVRVLYQMINQESDRFENRLSNAKQIRINVIIATLGYLLAIVLAIYV